MKLFKMKKFISIGALGFLFLLSCGNQDRNEEYQCTLFDKGVPDKLRVDNTFYKKSLKLREYWVDEGKTYIRQCEKLN
jgi:hypothetical protein